ncbi:hypothetical protein LguiA_019294 [Lonicera macranthoides]
MGMFMSLMGKGLPSTQMLSIVVGTLYDKFIVKEINTFDEFHLAILDIYNTINAALPGKHYDAPPPEKVKACFDQWKQAKEPERKNLFIDFMKNQVNLNKLDGSTLLTGLVTPPAAMAAKRAGESLPQLSLIKSIPDVIFVPSATVLALISVKLSRRVFRRKTAS